MILFILFFVQKKNHIYWRCQNGNGIWWMAGDELKKKNNEKQNKQKRNLKNEEIKI